MLNNWVNSWFSIVKILWDLAQENLVNIQGSYGIWINIYRCQPYPRYGPLKVNQLKNDSFRYLGTVLSRKYEVSSLRFELLVPEETCFIKKKLNICQ